MPYQVQIANRADGDVDEILGDIRRRAPLQAARWHAVPLEALESLSEHPERYSFAPEAAELGIELRQMLYGKRKNVNRVLFVVSTNIVNALHIRRAARRLLRRGEL